MVQFIEAIKRPLKTDLLTVVLGAVFMGINFLGGVLALVLGWFSGIASVLSLFVHGLGVDAARHTLQHDHRMPVFHDYVDAFLSGLMVYVIGILYFLPAIIVLSIGVANSLPLIFAVLNTLIWSPVLAIQGFMLLVLRGAVYGLLTLILGILGALMLPIALQLFAENKRLSDAFQFGKILDVIATKEYWISWLVLIAYGLVLFGLATMLSILSVGILVVPAFGLAGYLWWMTWYTVFAEVTLEGTTTARKGKSKHAAHAKPARKFAYRKK